MRFLTSGFFVNCTSGSPDSWAKTVLHIDSNSRSNSIRFAMQHSAELQLCTMRHSTESQLCPMLHSQEFFGIARSRKKIFSAYTEAMKVTVYQKKQSEVILPATWQ
jgi:hypothetical protein